MIELQTSELTRAESNLLSLLREVYVEDDAQFLLGELCRKVEMFQRDASEPRRPLWNESDVVLIAYGDHINSNDRSPLASLDRACSELGLSKCFSVLHLLPFYPSTSDEGFSVVDYRSVSSRLGSWEDISRLSLSFELMFDFPLNHISSKSQWFRRFLAGESRFKDYFVEVPKHTDLSKVVRPRSHPLLSAYETPQGTRKVWTTFSKDQVDLNFQNPQVFLEMMDTFLFYLSKGARVVRMDAIAFLWKIPGTTCQHLPQTHAIVKMFRWIAEQVKPNTIVLTETNVPHEENISYFGKSDEAHMVYQFSLAPLLLEALITGVTKEFVTWLSSVCETDPGTTYLNFTASHDGIGVRPLRNLISQSRIDALVDRVRALGGEVSYKSNADGSESPYELNITYFTALAHDVPHIHIARFLLSQLLAASLKGVPAVYLPSLIGAENDEAGYKKSGTKRSLNRERFQESEFLKKLTEPGNAKSISDVYRRALELRREQMAFHPDASQEVREVRPGLLLVIRGVKPPMGQKIWVPANFLSVPQTIEIEKGSTFYDLLTKEECSGEAVELSPYQIRWLKKV